MISGFYPTEVIGKLRVGAEIVQWDINRVDPSGYRHHSSGHYKPDAKVPTFWIGGFTAQMESGRAMDFGEIAIPDNSGFYTDTVCFTFNLGEVNSHPDSFFNQIVSSIGQNLKAFNFRFWRGSIQAFSGYPDPTFYYQRSSSWRRGYALNPFDASGIINSGIGVQEVPTSMPNFPNLFAKSQDLPTVSGHFLENEFTQFVYTIGKFPSGNYPLGTYGGLGSKDFTFKLSYDYTDVNANIVNPEDLRDSTVYEAPELPDSELPIGVSGHWRLNEKNAVGARKRYSAASGFPTASLTLIEYSGAPGSITNGAVGFGSGIVASGHAVSGIAAYFSGTTHLQVEATNNPATLDFKNTSVDGSVSFTYTGWFTLSSIASDQGIMGKWHDAGASPRHQYHFYYSSTEKRFVWEVNSKDSVPTALYYHIFSREYGLPQVNKWYFFVLGYNVETNEIFMRINDLPIDSRPMADKDRGLRDVGVGDTPFALGSSNTRTVSGTPTRMTGFIDSVTLWRGKVVSNQELLDLYNHRLDYPFSNKRFFDFSQPPIEEVDPDPYLKGSLFASYSLNRPSGSTTWPDDTATRPLTALSVKVGGSVGATSGIIGNNRIVAASGAAILSRNAHYGSGYLRTTSTTFAHMEPDHSFSIGVWVKLTSLSRESAIAGIWQETGNNRHWLIRYIQSTNKFGFRMANLTTIGMPTELTSNITISANRWYLILVRRDVINNTYSMTIYDTVSGTSDTTSLSSAFAYNGLTSAAPFVIGAYNLNSGPVYSDIHVDQCAIWKHLLSDEQLSQYYNGGRGIEWESM